VTWRVKVCQRASFVLSVWLPRLVGAFFSLGWCLLLVRSVLSSRWVGAFFLLGLCGFLVWLACSSCVRSGGAARR